VPSQAGRADGAVAAEHSAAATRDEVLRNRLPALQAVTDAISNLSQPERGRLLLPSGFAAMLDLCDAVREVGDVSSMLGPTWALHQRIDWATAVALHAVPRAREAYQTFLASHVNGHRALLEVHTVFPSVGAGGTQWVTRVREVLKVWEAAHPGYSAEVSGGASQAVDVRDTLMAGMARYLAVIVTIIVFLVYYAFKSVMVPIRLAVALVFTLVATYGTGVIIYQTPLLHPWFPFLRDFNGISYEVIPHVTGIAISLGLDYDIFLVSRVVEFRMSRYTDRASIFRGVFKTGDVISGAGLIMALAFTGMCFSSKLFFQQFGVLLIVSVLLDTFVVRTVLVPALMLVAQDWNWWPRDMPPAIHDVLEGEVESSGGLSKPILDGVDLGGYVPLGGPSRGGASEDWTTPAGGGMIA